MLREFRLDNQATARKVGGATADGLESALLEFLDRETDATFKDRFDRAKGIEEQLSVLTEYSRSHPDAFAKKPWLSNLRSFLIQSQRPDAMARRVREKLADPDGNPPFTVKEASFKLGKSRSTIYRWVVERKLKWHGSAGKIDTKSVKRLLDNQPE
jgi:hypothetical protein